MDTKQARNAGDRARFTTRIVFLEDPNVAEELERSAIEAGRSVAAEIRGAIRYWLSAWEKTDD